MDFSSLIIPLVSILASFLTIFFNIRWDYKRHIKEVIFEKKNSLYIRFLNLLMSIQRNPYLQFDEKTLHALEKIQAEFFIYANKVCRDDFSKLKNTLQKIQTDYKNDCKNETAIEEDNIRIEADETAIFDIQAEDKHYKDIHKILDAQLESKLEISIRHIKQSLWIKD